MPCSPPRIDVINNLAAGSARMVEANPTSLASSHGDVTHQPNHQLGRGQRRSLANFQRAEKRY